MTTHRSSTYSTDPESPVPSSVRLLSPTVYVPNFFPSFPYTYNVPPDTLASPPSACAAPANAHAAASTAVANHPIRLVVCFMVFSAFLSVPSPRHRLRGNKGRPYLNRIEMTLKEWNGYPKWSPSLQGMGRCVKFGKSQ